MTECIVSITLALATAICLLVSLPQINAWEKANDYPYGKLCDVFHNCAEGR